MSDLAAFLNARLNEDQAAAEAAAAMLASAEPDREADLAICFDDGTSGNAFDWNPWDRVAAYDPARVLREVEAKRKIFAEHRRDDIAELRSVERRRCLVCLADRGRYPDDWQGDEWPCFTLRALAAAWSDHPDFDPEWRT